LNYLCTKKRSSPPDLGGAPKGQRRVDGILLLVLTVLYFPFRRRVARMAAGASYGTAKCSRLD
jgi:hypothetical protein